MKLTTIEINHVDEHEVILLLNEKPWLVTIHSTGYNEPMCNQRVLGPWDIRFWPKGVPYSWKDDIVDVINSEIPWE